MIFILPQISEQTFNQMLNSSNYRPLNFSNKNIIMMQHTNLAKQIQRKTKNTNVKILNLHLLGKQNDFIFKNKKNINSELINKQIRKLNKKEIQNYKLEKFTRKKEDFMYKKPTKNLISLYEIIHMINDIKLRSLTDIFSRIEIISFMYKIFQIIFSTITLDLNYMFRFFISS